MKPDDRVCLCFRVTKRKLVNFIAREKPQVPSQLSMCGGAGTGCGWCIPFLKLLFRQETGKDSDIIEMSAEDYARQRAEYIREGKGKPPTGADPSAS
jgi:NAD(P)H-nitrite reductase large subunit